MRNADLTSGAELTWIGQMFDQTDLLTECLEMGLDESADNRLVDEGRLEVRTDCRDNG